MIRNIITAAVRVGLGIQNCLYVNELSAIITWDDISFANTGDNKNLLDITVREFVKTVFAGLGIEVEFSGKNEHEKGVIIDVEEDKIMLLDLNIDVIKFGQTIVRVAYDAHKLAVKQFTNTIVESGKKLDLHTGSDLDTLIKGLIKESLVLENI
ncbi:hypothetical protein [Mucilaginibacter boryungensis]|uniref:Uncharacterized protein n=1 Tax=Mucilaginibacter boryungensis TaxID=768480 RepID=A0ABR9XL23_9SPHI|nr:hypothetical protein [Mucilaginibacter boryungensis]MBE9667920.1 hypothetical protein [Mucilaginibacter boryungensis]